MKEFIESAKIAERKAEGKKRKKEYALRKKKAKGLLEKFKDDKEAQEFILNCYEQDVVANSYEFGTINFSPKGKEEVVGADKMSYNDYIEV